MLPLKKQVNITALESRTSVFHTECVNLCVVSRHGADLKSHRTVHDTRCEWSKHVFAVDMASVGTLTCVGESVVGRIHSLKNYFIQVKSSSSDIKNNKIITTSYYGNNKLLDT